MPRTPQTGTKVGATSSRKQILRREQIPPKLLSIDKLNWKGARRTLFAKQTLPTFLRQNVIDKTAPSSGSVFLKPKKSFER